MEYVVYILFSQKLNRHYIGFTSNLALRLEFHLNEEQTRKFTSKGDDWVLVFKIICVNKKQAMLIEKHIKSMKSRKYIENMITYPEISQKLLEKYFEASDC
jgi:putative endonuclease